MKKYIKFRIVLLFFICTVSHYGICQSVKVAVASSLLLPFQEIERKFEEKYPYQVEIIPGASGTLVSQIMSGAPYHLFVSAEDRYIEELVLQERAHGGPITLCFGTVFLWVREGIDGLDIERILKSDKVKSIGLAHPDLAPYGKQARDWLERRKLGLLVHEKIVYGNSIGQIHQYIAAKSVDVAFVSNSLKFSKENTGGRFLEVSGAEMEPVPNAMIMLKTNGASMFIATLMKDFLQGKEAKKVFEQYGYQMPVGR